MRWRRPSTPKARGVALEAVARLFNHIGVYRSMRADFATARQAFERALAIDEKAFGPDHPNVARHVNNLGMVLKDLGDLDDARKAFQRALAIDEKAFGPDHPNVARDVNNLGGVLQDLGDLDGARKAYQRALAIVEKAFGPDHPNVATTSTTWAWCSRTSATSTAPARRSSGRWPSTRKPSAPTTRTWRIRVNNLGVVLKDLGDLDGARKAFERALAIDEKAFGPDHPNVARRRQQPGRGAPGPRRPRRRPQGVSAGAGHLREGPRPRPSACADRPQQPRGSYGAS